MSNPPDSDSAKARALPTPKQATAKQELPKAVRTALGNTLPDWCDGKPITQDKKLDDGE